MMRSSASLRPDDIHVHCRVRRSESLLNVDLGSERSKDSVCTMRQWSAQNTGVQGGSGSGAKSTQHNEGPELIMQQVHVVGRKRSSRTSKDNSPSTSRNRSGSRSRGQQQPGKNGKKLIRQRSPEPSNGSRNRTSRRPSVPVNNHQLIWKNTRQRSYTGDNADADDNLSLGSFRSDGGRPDEEEPKPPVTIPLSDIVVVDVHGSIRSSDYDTQRPLKPLFLTTKTHGYWELKFSTENAHDMLLAFLTANLPRERIVFASLHNKDDGSVQNHYAGCEAPLVRGLRPHRRAVSPIGDGHGGGGGGGFGVGGCGEDLCTTGASTYDDASLDMEGLTAHQMRDRVRRETITEKIKRRLHHLAKRFGELSVSFSECSCGCEQAEEVTKDGNKQGIVDSTPPSTRSSSASSLEQRRQQYQRQEQQPNTSTQITNKSIRETLKRHGMNCNNRFEMVASPDLIPMNGVGEPRSNSNDIVAPKESHCRPDLQECKIPSGISLESTSTSAIQDKD